MTTVPSALEGTDHGVLVEGFKIRDGKVKGVIYCTLDGDSVRGCVNEWDWATGSELCFSA